MNTFPTSRQLEIMKVVKALGEDKHRAPTTSFIAGEMNLTDRGARLQLESLERKGLLEAQRSQKRTGDHDKKGGWRRWKVTPQGMAWIEAL